MILERIGRNRHLLIDQRMVPWVLSRIDGRSGPAWSQAIGLVLDGKIVAGLAVLNHWKDASNCEIAFAADTPRWAGRDSIRRMMAWPFIQLDCKRVTAFIGAKNERSLKLCEGLGFRREGVMRKGNGDDDAVMLGLLRDEAPRWMLAATDKMA